MKPLTLLLVGVAIACVFAHSVAADDAPTIRAAIAKDQDTKPADTFPADVPQLYAFFKTRNMKSGDKVRCVWIAEDVGDAAPKETKIDDSTLTADNDHFDGAFSLSKPTKGWPVGKYRVDIYAGDTLAVSVKFTIEPAGADKGGQDGSK